jgi:hypothetical protein
MTFENAAHGLVTDGVPKVGQGADDSVVAPGAILLGHADDQRFQIRIDRGATGSLALLRAVKFLGDQCAVPAENRIGLDDLRHFQQGLLAQLLADDGEGFALAITQLDATFELVA